MRDTILKIAVIILIVLVVILYTRSNQYERKVSACQGLIQRVYLDKPRYYLDTLCYTEEYSDYVGVFDYKEPAIDN